MMPAAQDVPLAKPAWPARESGLLGITGTGQAQRIN
jgi:hypothetical protein